MNDDDMLAAMRSSLTSTKDALTHVHMDQRPETIIARARGRRLRRGLPGVGAGALALGLGLALFLPGGHPAGPSGSPTASGARDAQGVHVNLAAWSVNTSPAGLVNVTIRELKDPAGLSKALADAGVPVVLTSGPVCTSDDQLQISRVVRKLPGPGGLLITINPKAMPAGTELVIGIGTLRIGSQQGPAAAFGLQKKGSPLNCGKPKAATK
ncbi:hypothetical protein Pth03_40030 [Planotetraspora thailandica]|uniref:Uncharacterized protein n=1 Tax=Planotetraspora thailandica TaxID=487172 RepID=A0A8J3V0U8_9ACTN|nr:hypothetical protein [Planotetraspora thailandica]GII55614.1 hypothetical protein Pth03_40030 [Planotetraspora thailandica]